MESFIAIPRGQIQLYDLRNAHASESVNSCPVVGAMKLVSSAHPFVFRQYAR
jgi:hypothetical protein